jgi:hypothetical protein
MPWIHGKVNLWMSYILLQDQWVSHGFVYKKQHQGKRRTVGKRLLCSNRYGRSGCGQTRRLYLATELAFLHYTTVRMTLFLVALLAGDSIQKAYQTATHTTEPRNAYRWLNKLHRKIMDYRALLKTPCARQTYQSTVKTKPRGIVLSTLQLLFSTFTSSLTSFPNCCAQYQHHTQTTFI